jgi:RecA-family ATPase
VGPPQRLPFNALLAHCERIRPDAVILDPLVAINAVHENDNMLIRRVMVIVRSQIAERFHAAVVLIHHDNKGGDDTEDGDQRNVRGGGDINAVRFELAVKKMTIAQAEQMSVDTLSPHS